MTRLTLTADREGERLDAFLARAVPELTRSAAQRLAEEGAITLSGRPVKKNYRTSPGDLLEAVLPDPESVDVKPQNIPLDVVYEDRDVIVVNKPVGMVVHPAPGHPDGTLVNALLYHCGDSLSGINGALRPGIVHRIDRDTSGLIIAAKNDRAHLALAAQLQDHTLARVYEAVAVGGFREDAGTVDAPIGRHPVDRKKMAVDRKNGRPAVTHWAVLGRYSGYTHLECGPTRFGCIWPHSAILCWGTRYMEAKSLGPGWPDSAFMPGGFNFFTLPPERRWSWSVPCLIGLRQCCGRSTSRAG